MMKQLRSNVARTGAVLLAVLMVTITVQPGYAQSAQGQQVNLPTGVWPRALAFDGQDVWVADGFDNAVIRIGEADGKTIDKTPIPVGDMPDAMAWDSFHNMMWVGGYNDLSLTLIDGTGKVQQTLTKAGGSQLGGHPVGIVYAKTFMWIAGQNDNGNGEDGVWQFDTGTKQAVKKVAVGNFPTAIVAAPDEKHLWVANGNDDTVTMIDITNPDKPTTATFSDSIPAFPIALAFDGAYLWVGNYEGTIVKIDGLTGKALTLSFKITGRPVNVATNKAPDGHAWIVTGHGASVTDVNSQAGTPNDPKGLGANTLLNPIQDPSNSKNTLSMYAGAALVTTNYVYVADWLNDRLVRFPVPAVIPVSPTVPVTNTAIPPTITVTPTFQCNMPPQFKPGDYGDVSSKTDPEDENMHSDPAISAQKVGVLPVGHKFKVEAGPAYDKDSKACFYKVIPVDDQFQPDSTKAMPADVWIVEAFTSTKQSDLHYFIEPISGPSS